MPVRALQYDLADKSDIFVHGYKKPNARKGITTDIFYEFSIFSIMYKKPNARKGITTHKARHIGRHLATKYKKPNARKGITTHITTGW